MFSGNSQFAVWATFGVAVGLYSFYRGFRALQRKRLIENIPTSKIRSAALGLVEVNGLACGPYTMLAPVTAKSCYFYRTTVWTQRQGKDKEWQKAADETLHVPFYLDDNTGHVLIDPSGAELDLHCDFHEEYGTSLFGKDEIPAGVRGFLTRHGVSADQRIKVEERCIKPKNALFVLGTLTENDGRSVTPPSVVTSTRAVMMLDNGALERRAQALKNDDDPDLETIRPNPTPGAESGEPRELIRLTAAPGPKQSSEMTQQGKIAAAMLRAGITNPTAWAVAGVSPTDAEDTASHAPLAEKDNTPENEPEFDLSPPVLITRGINDPNFLISWRSQRSVVQILGWKSMAMIWGGGALSIASAYVLASYFGWL
jgi:E3 ubiquitin ligase